MFDMLELELAADASVSTGGLHGATGIACDHWPVGCCPTEAAGVDWGRTWHYRILHAELSSFSWWSSVLAGR